MDDKLHREPTQAHPIVAPTLEITKGKDVGKSFTVKTMTKVGRELDNDIVLVDPRISRHHAQISWEADQWTITDLGSSNQTYLNGKPIIKPMELQSKDRIGLGEIELMFKTPDLVPGVDTSAKTTAAAQPTKSTRPTALPLPSTRFPLPWGQSAPPRLALIAGAFVLLLCLAATIAVFLVSRMPGDGGASPIAEASPAGVGAGGTAQPTNSASSSLAPPNLTLIYEDDFSDSFGGWDDAFDAYTTKQYGNNRYQIEVSTSNLIAWGLANRDVADFEVEVEARKEDGAEANSYGLLFRVQDRKNFYRFDISSDGFYLLSKFIDGQWTTLVDWAPSPHISPDTNLLRVSTFGPEIVVSVNGQQLISVSDDSLSHGNFGFFASTFTEPYIWVSYDNLKLWVPEGQEIALIPTVTRPSLPPTATRITTPTPTPRPTPERIKTATRTEPTPEPETEQIEEVEIETATPTRTPTVTPSSEPTATPVPLPEYASRDQLLARGEEAVSGRIVFPLFDPERNIYDIYIVDAADGSNRQLVQENASQPALNQVGTDIAYRSWQPDKRGLFARLLSGGDAWNFDPFFESARPDFSPVDDSLMYHSRVSGREPAVYRIVGGVGEVMRREGFPIQGEAANWSPDGQQFVYNSCLGGKCGIIRSNIDGTNPVILSDHPTDTNPEISPDGQTVVFMSKRSGDWEIYRVGIDGSNLAALTSDDANDGLPTWSPNGSKIAFVSTRDGKWAVWDMDPDGTNQRRLFLLGGPVDGIVQHDIANSRGWVEENIDWIP